MFDGGADQRINDFLHRAVAHADAGGLGMPAAAEALCDLHDGDFALTAEVDAHDARFAFGEEHGDLHAAQSAGDADLVVDVVGLAAGFDDVGVSEEGVGDASIFYNRSVIVDAAEKFKIGAMLGSAKLLADVGDIGAGADEIGCDVQRIGVGGGEAEPRRVAVNAGVKKRGGGLGERPAGLGREDGDHLAGAGGMGIDPVRRAEVGVGDVVVNGEGAGESFDDARGEVDALFVGRIDDDEGVQAVVGRQVDNARHVRRELQEELQPFRDATGRQPDVSVDAGMAQDGC